MTNNIEQFKKDLKDMVTIKDPELRKMLTAVQKNQAHIGCMQQYILENEHTPHDLKALAYNLLVGLEYITEQFYKLKQRVN